MSRSKANRKILKYPGLEPKVNPRIRRDYSDQDYINDLSDKEKDWLNRFNEEWVHANFNHNGKRIHPLKQKTKTIKKNGKKRSVDVYKQKCEHNNNARNRDAFAISKASNILEAFKPIEKASAKDEYEDKLIEMIDAENGIEKK